MNKLFKTILLIGISLSFIAKAQPTLCVSQFQDERNGFLPQVMAMKLEGQLMIKDHLGYLKENLGEKFAEALQNNSADFVTIATGNGPEALKEAKRLGYQLGEKVEKKVGFHQIRHATNRNGKKGYIIYRVNGFDREIHMQSFIKWFDFPSEKVFTIGKNKDWAPALKKFFAKMGPPPDLVVYGFAETTFFGLIKANPIANYKFWPKAYKALKPNKTPLTDDQPDLLGRPFQVVKLVNGKRIWFFKNMYGGLAGDLMRALSEYGAKDYLVLGTAGSLTTQFPVGHVFTPQAEGNGKGQYSPITVFEPLKNVPVIGNYEKVDTNNDQTPEWLQNAIARKVQAVEVELGYILDWARANPQVRVATALVISDIMVGENRRDMTDWNRDDLVPLRNQFVQFIMERLKTQSTQDLKLQEYNVELFQEPQ